MSARGGSYRGGDGVGGGIPQRRIMLNNNNINKQKKKKNGSATSGSSSTTAAGSGSGGMIKIRPYSKPPQLPPNYYESTAHTMLSGCLAMIEERLKLSSSSSSSSSSFSCISSPTMISMQSHNNNNNNNVSLQSAYNTTVDLVRHQFGTQLYDDIVQNMIAASILVLPILPPSSLGDTSAAAAAAAAVTTAAGLDGTGTMILPYITQQYSIYMDYILLLKHICLPLDRTHWWLWSTGTTTTTTTAGSNWNTNSNTNRHEKDDEEFIQLCAGKATTTTSAATTNNHNHSHNATTIHSPSSYTGTASSSSSSFSSQYQSQNMWSVGLTIFLRRLQYLQYDGPIYQQWISLFLNDWNPNITTSSGTGTGSGTTSSLFAPLVHSHNNEEVRHDDDVATITTTKKKEERLLLHNIWYMWQDLHILSSLSIQNDLQNYWTEQSIEWQSISTTGTTDTTTTTTTSSSTTSIMSSLSQSYSITDFVLFCHARMHHIHIHYRNIIQPIGWIYHIFDTCFIQHHMNLQYLFNDIYFFPLLQEHVFTTTSNITGTSNSGNSTMISSNQSGTTPTFTINHPSSRNILQYNTIQQLWILAGRIPQAQLMMSHAIQRYAKEEGLIRIRYTTPSIGNKTNNPGITAMSTKLAMTSTTNATSAVEDLLELQNALNVLVQQLPKGVMNHNRGSSMNKNETNNTAGSATTIISFKSVWEEVVNADVYPMSIAEQLAKFLDTTLRSNKKIDTFTGSSTAISVTTTATATTSPTTAVIASHSSLTSEYSWLQRIIHGIFIPLQSKDIFEAFYKRDLAKRLLWNRIVSMDAERYICSLLKAECGTAYTSKIEGMFQDVDWSRETMLVYKQSVSASNTGTTATINNTIGSNDIEVEVQVLTTGYWPVYPVYPNLIIPDTLNVPQEQFAQHYHSKYQGRRMIWQYALGHCVVRVNGYNKPYELLVSLCQALVLIQFTSDKVCLSLPQLLQATGLDDRNEMERILQSLALGKDGTRILRKLEHTAEPGKKTKILMTIDDRDTFVINTKFESKSRRIRITNIMMKETKEEREKTVETVSRDRLYLIDAVLVRIMKARKTILHQALIPQVLEQVKVPAQASDIKKRIESLIEREYMERDASDHNRYNYLA